METARKTAKNIVILKDYCHVCNLDGYKEYNKTILSFLRKED
jgi:hypothetical protein